jgi:hypothetical protein
MVEKRAVVAVKKTAAVSGASARSASKPAITAAQSSKAPHATTAEKQVVKKSSAATAKPVKAPPLKTSAVPAAEKKVVTAKKDVAAAVVKNVTVKKVSAPEPRIAADTKKVVQPTFDERCRMVETAAYFIAERNGFSGCAADYWAAAELEVAKKLGS